MDLNWLRAASFWSVESLGQRRSGCGVGFTLDDIGVISLCKFSSSAVQDAIHRSDPSREAVVKLLCLPRTFCYPCVRFRLDEIAGCAQLLRATFIGNMRKELALL